MGIFSAVFEVLYAPQFHVSEVTHVTKTVNQTCKILNNQKWVN